MLSDLLSEMNSLQLDNIGIWMKDYTLNKKENNSFHLKTYIMKFKYECKADKLHFLLLYYKVRESRVSAIPDLFLLKNKLFSHTCTGLKTRKIFKILIAVSIALEKFYLIELIIK